MGRVLQVVLMSSIKAGGGGTETDGMQAGHADGDCKFYCCLSCSVSTAAPAGAVV